MKNIFKNSLFLVLMLVCVSCMDRGLENLNDDTKNATKAEPETFFTHAIKALVDNTYSIAYRATGPGVTRMWAQYFTSATYLEGATYIPEFSWSALYIDVLRDLDESRMILAETASSADDKEISNKQAMIEIMKVYTYASLVEAYGDIPYSESLDFENNSPKYDDAQTVYLDLLSRLDAAVSSLDPNFGGFGSADLIYEGEVTKWIKFGNALKLRMGMRIIDALPAEGTKFASEAASGLLIESNEDNAVFQYLTDYPNTSPWWNFLVRQGLKYYIGTNTFVDKLNDLDDPRRAVFFTPMEDGTYKGAQYGITQDYYSFSKEGEYLRQPDLPVVLIDYQQVEFLLAEAAERKVPGVTSAETHYNNAIKASFAYYGIPEQADDYLAQPGVNYATAAGDWKEKIGVQKWIALFDQGFEAWTEYRRLDYPKLSAPKVAESDVVPLRFLYPISEQTLNGDSYNAASANIGGDTYSTKLFWDVH